jgi:hypothetical protein
MNLKTLFVSALAVALSSAAANAGIAINFYGASTAFPNQLGATSLAGVAAVAQTNWNNLKLSNGDANGYDNGLMSTTVTDDTGAVVAGFSVIAGGSTYMNYNDGGDRPGAKCFYNNGAIASSTSDDGYASNGTTTLGVISNGGFYGESGATGAPANQPAVYVDLTGIPYAQYNLYVYLAANGVNGGKGSVLISPILGASGTVDSNLDDGVFYCNPWGGASNTTQWNLASDGLGTYTAQGDYIELTGNTASSVELTLEKSSTGFVVPIAGVQVVPTPEPASLALMIVGGLLVLPRRRRA